MKFFTSIFLVCISIAAFGCSCPIEASFCNVIKTGSLLQSGSFEDSGIVCIIESTGNVSGNYDFDMETI